MKGHSNDESLDIVTTSSQAEAGRPTRKEASLEEVFECLGVPIFDTTKNGSGCQFLEIIIQRSVENHFPKPPADLQQHVLNIQETVIKHLKETVALNAPGLMGRLIDCYHRKIFSHLDTLLHDSHSTHNTFVLLNWVMNTYLRYILYRFNSSPIPQLQEITQTSVV